MSVPVRTNVARPKVQKPHNTVMRWHPVGRGTGCTGRQWRVNPRRVVCTE